MACFLPTIKPAHTLVNICLQHACREGQLPSLASPGHTAKPVVHIVRRLLHMQA